MPALRGIVAVPILNTLGIVPSSREHGTTIVTLLYFPHSTTSGLALADTERYARYLGPRLHAVGATGAEPARVAQFDLLSSRLHWTEGATVLLIVLIVGIALRAVLAPILTVLCAGLAFLISQRLLGWLEAALGPDDAERATGSGSRPDARGRHRLLGLLLHERPRGAAGRAAHAGGGAPLHRPQHADRVHGRRRRRFRRRLA